MGLSGRSLGHRTIRRSQVPATDIIAGNDGPGLEVDLGGSKDRGSFLVLLLCVPSGHDLIILTLKLHLLDSLPLNAIKQGALKLLQLLHLVDVSHDVPLLPLHTLPVQLFLRSLLPHFLLSVLLYLLGDGTLEEASGTFRSGSRVG